MDKFIQKHYDVVNSIQQAKSNNLSLTQMALRQGKQEDFFYDYSRRTLPKYFEKKKISVKEYNEFIEAYLPFKQKQRMLTKAKEQSKFRQLFSKIFG